MLVEDTSFFTVIGFLPDLQLICSKPISYSASPSLFLYELRRPEVNESNLVLTELQGSLLNSAPSLQLPLFKLE